MATTHVQVTGADVVYHELRAMRTFADLWGPYVCGDLARRTHVLDVGRRAPRTLIKGEAFWWALGFFDAHQDGERIWALQREKIPHLLTMDEAGELVPDATTGRPLTAQGVRRIADWYPVHAPHPPAGAAGLGGRARYVFEAQAEAVAAQRRQDPNAGTAALRWWQAVQQLLPPLVKITAAGRDITPAESPNPLPIPAGRAEALRRAAALRVGHGLGWWVYRHPTEVGFAVELSGGRVEEVPGEGALPWVLGFADALSPQAAALVAYRPGLG